MGDASNENKILRGELVRRDTVEDDVIAGDIDHRVAVVAMDVQIAEDGMRCLGGWCQSQSAAISERVRLKTPASPALDDSADGPFKEIGPAIIRWLKSRQGAGQPIRTDGPETHLKKQGTPNVAMSMAQVGAQYRWPNGVIPYMIDGNAPNPRGGPSSGSPRLVPIRYRRQRLLPPLDAGE